jgi:hypothetical protein
MSKFNFGISTALSCLAPGACAYVKSWNSWAFHGGWKDIFSMEIIYFLLKFISNHDVSEEGQFIL